MSRDEKERNGEVFEAVAAEQPDNCNTSLTSEHLENLAIWRPRGGANHGKFLQIFMPLRELPRLNWKKVDVDVLRNLIIALQAAVNEKEQGEPALNEKEQVKPE